MESGGGQSRSTKLLPEGWLWLRGVSVSTPFLSKLAEQEMKPSFLLVPLTTRKDKELWEVLSPHRTVSWILPDTLPLGHASLLLRAFSGPDPRNQW